MSDINWARIQEVWEEGAISLQKVAVEYGVAVPEIALKAAQEGWAERGTTMPIVPALGIDMSDPMSILDDKQVQLAHKTDLGRIRLLATVVMEQLQHETEYPQVLKATEKLAKIYAQVIPLERKVFGLDADTDDTPDGVHIHVGGKRKVTINN